MLDEPATGLDPGGMRDMRDLIRQLSASGMTVMVSSHLLTEVEEVCNRVAIVRSGRVAYQGRLDDLRAQAGEGYVLRTTEDGIARRVAEAQAGISEVRPGPDGGLTFSATGPGSVSALSVSLIESGALIEEMSRRHATLEDLFFSLTEGDAAGSPAAAPDPEPAQA
jgi:ABC-2 type transport system ATP-binding protein